MIASSPESGRINHWVHWTLLAGLAASTLLLATGLFAALRSGQPRPETRPPSIAILVEHAARGDGVALLNLGVLLLILTPAGRVTVLGVGWLLQREWRFAAIAFSVLALLVFSMLTGVR
jgi:hypothetical protein